ncbi:MAG: hypothetical protein ACK5CW_09380 [Verrucomicrobiota bacterium]
MDRGLTEPVAQRLYPADALVIIAPILAREETVRARQAIPPPAVNDRFYESKFAAAREAIAARMRALKVSP